MSDWKLSASAGWADGARIFNDFWDFWAVKIFATNLQQMMVLGTLLGSAIGAIVVLEITSLYTLLALLFILSFLMFATRGVNLGIVQIFFGAFIIILLNIIFPAGLEYAEARIVDVALGGILSVATVYVLGWRKEYVGKLDRVDTNLKII